MENRKCVLCYRDYIVITSDLYRNCKKTETGPIATNKDGYGGTDEESKILTSQIPVIRLLRNILEIPQDMCTEFLQDYGNPSSWIYCCDACKPSVAKTEVLLQQISSLEKQVAVLRTELKDAIELSIEKERRATGIQRGPTEIIRSYIMQQRTRSSNERLGQCSINIVTDDQEFEMAEDELNRLNDDAAQASVEEDSSVQLSPDMEGNYFASINTDVVAVPEISNQNIAEPSQDQSCNSLNLPKKWIRHQRRKGRMVYKCTFCSEVFKVKTNLECHIRIHTRETPYSCLFCKKKFKSKSNLVGHLRVHTGERPYSCSICKKKFKDKYYVSIHERVHTGERPYSCAICKKSFQGLSNLSRHIRVHNGEMPYKCEVCSRTFKWIDGLSKHKKIHIRKGPYSCCICHRVFAKLISLAHHSRIHKKR